MTSETNAIFESVKQRLDEIVDAVGDETISLDDALDLYEEAVKLGMQASTLLEEGIAQQEDVEEPVEGADEGDAADEAPQPEGLERSAEHDAAERDDGRMAPNPSQSR